MKRKAGVELKNKTPDEETTENTLWLMLNRRSH
jgi:hypothetical protein